MTDTLRISKEFSLVLCLPAMHGLSAKYILLAISLRLVCRFLEARRFPLWRFGSGSGSLWIPEPPYGLLKDWGIDVLTGMVELWLLCLSIQEFMGRSLQFWLRSEEFASGFIPGDVEDDEVPRCHEAYSWLISVYVQSLCLCGVRAFWRLCFDEEHGNAGHSL